jgi:hypothetical protein
MKIIKSRANVNALLLVAVVAVGLSFYFSQNLKPLFSVATHFVFAQNSANVQQPHEVQQQTKQALDNGKASTVAQRDGSAQVKQEEWPTVVGSPQNKAEINAWLSARGYRPNFTDIDEYASYDKATVEQLAQNGDIRAMQRLGDLLLGVDAGFAKSKSAFTDAAVHGSTAAMEAIGTVLESFVYSNAKTVLEKREAVLDVLAWYNAAALRGDRLPISESAGSFIRINKIGLSDQDRVEIQARSQKIYDDLLQKRRALGLGEFDNTVPDSVNKYFDFLEGK